MKKWLKFGIVNLFTTIRMVGIFALVPLYLTLGGVALGLTNIACFLTDFIDGKLARKLEASTFFGSIYDGISDKAFLAVNFAILCSITPWALLPVGLELGIIGAQYLKYKNNLNVQSNIIGKAKMWVAGFAIVLANMLVDVEALTFLGHNIISKISSVSDASLVGKALTPVVLAEAATLISYLMEYFKESKELANEVDKKNPMEQKDSNDLEKIKAKKQEIIEEKEKLLTLKEMLFDHDFYMEHKDENGLKLLKQRTKKNKK